MKKIILLIIPLLLLSGCYDYKEINNLAFVSSIAIDYQDEDYIVTLEVLNDNVEKESNKITTYFVEGKDKTVSKAIEKAANKVAKEVSYTHIELMVLGENILKDKLSTLSDFFLRSTYFRENFYLTGSIDNNPADILKNTTKETPIASDAIIKLLESNDYASNSAILKTFDDVIQEILTFGKDTVLSNISILEDKFVIDGMLLFKDYNYVKTLDNDYATMYNILTNNFYRPIFTKEYEDNNFFSSSIVAGNPKIEIDNTAISIKGDLYGKIIDNGIGLNIRKLDNLEKINQEFTDLLNEKITDFINELQNADSDILGLSENYYYKTRKKNYELWKSIDVKSNIKFQINKKGLIYEAPNEE